IFVIDGSNNVLQLTNFRRAETVNPTLTADGQRIIFAASADHPSLHTNPTEDCQIFSIDRTGGDLRQLTHFHAGEGPRSMGACVIPEPPRGCGVVYMSRDTRSDALVFYSACDPFDANPYGAQLFAMRTDGTGLTQLTTTQGLSRDLSGGFRVEQVFPFAYPG